MSLSELNLVGGDLISAKEFARVRSFIYRHCGIDLTEAKKVMVSGRLRKRLVTLNIEHFDEYFDFVQLPGNQAELQLMVDILTTNETYFFREPDHFKFLESLIRSRPNHPFRIWSAASSSGEEIYSIAMVLADFCHHQDWSVLGSDISVRVLEKAQKAHYQMERIEGLSQERLRKYCLRGVGTQQGSFIIDPDLKRHTEFRQINLLKPGGWREQFDIIFLRNVMIYFDQQSKQTVLEQVIQRLKKGGYLFISHTESLFNTQHELKTIRPSIYQKL